MRKRSNGYAFLVILLVLSILSMLSALTSQALKFHASKHSYQRNFYETFYDSESILLSLRKKTLPKSCEFDFKSEIKSQKNYPCSGSDEKNLFYYAVVNLGFYPCLQGKGYDVPGVHFYQLQLLVHNKKTDVEVKLKNNYGFYESSSELCEQEIRKVDLEHPSWIQE